MADVLNIGIQDIQPRALQPHGAQTQLYCIVFSGTKPTLKAGRKRMDDSPIL
jgi:hypothetical protein